MNFGNSDISVPSKQFNDDYLFRTQKNFRPRLSSIAEALDSYNGEIRKDGTLNPPLEVYDSEIKSNVCIPDIRLPILKAVYDEFLPCGLTEIVGFLTDQGVNESHEQDTIDFKRILEGDYGKTCFPDIQFSFETIRDNPSDYSKMLEYYRSYFMTVPREKDYCIVIAQGTPAMGYALSLSCAECNPVVKQYYASRYKYTETTIQPLHPFSKQAALEKINPLCALLDLGNYEVAKELVTNDSWLSQIPGLDHMVSYLSNRQNYLFSEAIQCINLLRDYNSELYDTIRTSLTGVDSFDECIIYGDCDALNDNTPYLLFESLQNARFAFETKNYYQSLAFLFSYFETYQRVVVARYLECKTMTKCKSKYTKQDSSYYYKEINDYIIDELSKGHNLDFWWFNSAWNKEECQLKFAGEVPKNLIVYMSKWGKPKYIKAAGKLLSKIPLDKLKKLRNKSPMAHNVNGITKEIIDEKSGGDYLQLLDSSEKALWKMLPNEWPVPTRYHDASKAIREYLINYFLKMIA